MILRGSVLLAELMLREGLTFDDVLLVPQKSDVTPDMINLETKLTKALQKVGELFGLGHKKIGLDGKFIESASKNKFLNTLTISF